MCNKGAGYVGIEFQSASLSNNKDTIGKIKILYADGKKEIFIQTNDHGGYDHKCIKNDINNSVTTTSWTRQVGYYSTDSSLVKAKVSYSDHKCTRIIHWFSCPAWANGDGFDAVHLSGGIELDQEFD
eukprot:Pgem_evm1s9018